MSAFKYIMASRSVRHDGIFLRVEDHCAVRAGDRLELQLNNRPIPVTAVKNEKALGFKASSFHQVVFGPFCAFEHLAADCGVFTVDHYRPATNGLECMNGEVIETRLFI